MKHTVMKREILNFIILSYTLSLLVFSCKNSPRIQTNKTIPHLRFLDSAFFQTASSKMIMDSLRKYPNDIYLISGLEFLNTSLLKSLWKYQLENTKCATLIPSNIAKVPRAENTNISKEAKKLRRYLKNRRKNLILAEEYIKELEEIFYDTKVQAFIPKEKLSYTRFYNKAGGEILDSIQSTEYMSWICVTVDSYINNWVKLKTVKISPVGRDYYELKNSWIPIKDLWLNLSNDSSLIYSEPIKNSKSIIVPFHMVNLIEIKDSWVKVKFESEGQLIIGWVAKENQCASPWTTCNYD